MKKLFKIYFLFPIAAILFTSCSDEKGEKGKNFIKMIETSNNGVAENSIFTYNENHIISNDNTKEKVDYTYNAQLITKIVSYNKQTKATVTLDYTYLRGKLMTVTSSENYVIKYMHNSDGSIDYEKFLVDAQKQQKKIQHGTLFFKKDNLIKDNCIFDQTNQDLVSSTTMTFRYDDYNNPFSSIIGYDKLLDHGALISKNNTVMTVVENTIVSGNQTTSSANMYATSFKYDADKYPTEQVSEASMTNPNYCKIQYLY